MNIAYIITGMGLGGAEIVTVDIANEMAKRGHNIMIMYLNGENEHSDRIHNSIQCVGLNMRKSPLGMIEALFKARKILRIFSANVIHGNMIHANIFARLLRIITPMKILISSEHNKNIEGQMRMLAYRFTDFLSNFNTNVSQEAVNYFVEQKAFKKNKSFVMYNGINLNRFVKNDNARVDIRAKYGINADEFLWINVGRLTDAKDQNNLLKAFAMVGKGKLMIVGKGELEDDLRNVIAELNIQNKVILAGAHSNIEDYYSAADAFVLSSAWEGFGIVLAEAMACNLPVVTTHAGGCAEVVDNNDWVVPVRDSSKLADKMMVLANLNESQKKEIGLVNCQKAQRFDIHTICNKWEDVYYGTRWP